MVQSNMTDLVYDEVRRDVCGTATDTKDWATKCTQFQQETGVVIDNPLSTNVTQRGGVRYYTTHIPEMKR